MIKQSVWIRNSYKYYLQYLDIRSSWITEMNIFELQIPFDVLWFVSSLWKTVNFRILNKTKFNDYSIIGQTIAFLRNMLQQIPKIGPRMATQVEDGVCLRKYSFSENRLFLKST